MLAQDGPASLWFKKSYLPKQGGAWSGLPTSCLDLSVMSFEISRTVQLLMVQSLINGGNRLIDSLDFIMERHVAVIPSSYLKRYHLLK